MSNEPLKVGVLLPQLANSKYSKIFHRSLQKSFLLEHEEYDVELTPAFCGRGELQNVINGVNQLIDFYEVDAIAALSSYASISSAFPQIKRAKVPLCIANLGEHLIPLTEKETPRGHLVSFNFWQDAMALGRFAGNNYKNGAVIGSIFEVGYAYSQCFQFGCQQIDPKHQILLSTASEEITDDELSGLVTYFEEHPQGYCFLLTDETSGIKALTQLSKSDQLKELTIICLPHLRKALTSIEHEFKIVTTSQFLTDPELELTTSFDELAKVVSQVLIHDVKNTRSEAAQTPLPDHDKITIADLLKDSSSFNRVIIESKAGDHETPTEVITEEVDLSANETWKDMRNGMVASWMNLYPLPS